MNIIEKKKLAMDKIMAIPLENWVESSDYKNCDESDIGGYITELNGVKLVLLLDGHLPVIKIGDHFSYSFPELGDLIFRIVHNKIECPATEKIFDKLCK